jgi:hypothetical protein
MDNGVADRLVNAIAAQDEAAITACFAPEVEFIALTPNGIRERSGAEETGALFARWFGDATVLDLDGTEATEVADRLRIAYRFTGVEEGESFVVEQQLYCTVSDGLIQRAELLCSGFLPR